MELMKKVLKVTLKCLDKWYLRDTCERYQESDLKLENWLKCILKTDLKCLDTWYLKEMNEKYYDLKVFGWRVN